VGHHRSLLCRTRMPHELGGGHRWWDLYPPLNLMFKFRSRVWWESVLLLHIYPIGTTTWRPPGIVWWKLQNTLAPKVSESLYGGLGAAEEGRAQEERRWAKGMKILSLLPAGLLL
jgi:hypothetical protein